MLRARRASFLLGGILLALSSASLVACGSTSAAPARPPTAAELVTKPENSGITDAHFTASTAIPAATGVTVNATGEGVLVYKPEPAIQAKFQATVGAQTIVIEVITIGGSDYSKITPGSAKWTKTATTSNPARLSDSTGATLVGEESISGDAAWHVKAKDKAGDPFELWVRKKDGYPLKLISTPSAGNASLTLTFDHFNTGVTVSPPPADQVQA